jgi:GntR family transcriptional regulator, transcriptional repressor for pyruvate dehydrogenase complex
MTSEPGAALSASISSTAHRNKANTAGLPVVPVRPAYEQIADQLRSLIMHGRLRPGERLPPEPALGAMFGVGRTTIREALRLLTSQGLVTTKRGVSGGTFVIVPDRDVICRYLESSLGLLADSERPGVNSLLEARAALEIPATRLAAARHNTDQLERIEQTLDRAASNEDMYQSEFHIAVLEASGNVMLEVMARPVFDVLRTRLVRSAAPATFWDRVVSDHRRILAAISAREEGRAAAAMSEHLSHLESVYQDIDTALHPDLSAGLHPNGLAIARTGGRRRN